MNEELTTIEGLAGMTQRTMASKEDVQALDKKISEGLESMNERLSSLDARVGRIEPGVHASRERWCIGRSLRMRLTVSHTSRRSSALRAASSTRRATLPFPEPAGSPIGGFCMLY